jgi:hypothetical protein
MKDEEDDNIIPDNEDNGAGRSSLRRKREDEGAEEIIKVDASKFEGHFMIIPKKAM